MLLRLLSDKHMVRNRIFTFTTGDSRQSRLRRLQNSLSQGSVLASLLFQYRHIRSAFHVYGDDLALLYASRDCKAVEDTLSQVMATLSACLLTWRLMLSNTKTVTAAFHLNNRETKREFNVFNNGNLLQSCPVPTHLGIKLDKSLTFRHHLEALCKKLSTRIALLRRIAGSG